MSRRPPALRGLALAALLALAAACSAAAPPPPAILPEVAPPAALWVPAELPIAGISVELPGAPEEVSELRRLPQGEVPIDGLRLADGDDRTPDYAALRVRVTGPWREAGAGSGVLIALAQALLGPLKPEAEAAHQGFAGQAFTGTDAARQVTARAFSVGDSVYLLSVEAAPGRVDPRDAERFFGSFQLELPWRLVASPVDRFTVSVPAPAIDQPLAPGGTGGSVRHHAFSLGGEHQVAYGVTCTNVDRDELANADPDKLVHKAAMALDGSEGGRRVERIQPISLHGAPGREVFAVDGDGWHMRVRVFLVGAQLYVVTMAAKSAAPLEDEHAARFFDSFQPGRRP